MGARCVTARRIGGVSRPVTSELTHIDPSGTWGVRGTDGPIRATGGVLVEPLDGSRSGLTISVGFAGHGIGRCWCPSWSAGRRARGCRKHRRAQAADRGRLAPATGPRGGATGEPGRTTRRHALSPGPRVLMPPSWPASECQSFPAVRFLRPGPVVMTGVRSWPGSGSSARVRMCQATSAREMGLTMTRSLARTLRVSGRSVSLRGRGACQSRPLAASSRSVAMRSWPTRPRLGTARYGRSGIAAAGPGSSRCRRVPCLRC